MVPRAVHGYDTINNELRHARYLDFSWIYAAGAVCSTLGDLIAWVEALHGGQILGGAMYRQMTTADTLLDGTRLRYTMALAVDTILGHRAIHHGGDITGFTRELTWLPDDSLAIVVLINTQGGVRPDAFTREVVRAVVRDKSAVGAAFRGRTGDYVGQCAGSGRASRIAISRDSTGAALTARINDGSWRTLTYLGDETFALGDIRYVFGRRNNRVTTLHFDDVYDVTATARVLDARDPLE